MTVTVTVLRSGAVEHRVDAIVVTDEHGRNLRIHHDHTPTNAIKIECADRMDLLVALMSAIGVEPDIIELVQVSPTCRECGARTNAEGDCGPCANCGQPLCLHFSGAGGEGVDCPKDDAAMDRGRALLKREQDAWRAADALQGQSGAVQTANRARNFTRWSNMHLKPIAPPPERAPPPPNAFIGLVPSRLMGRTCGGAIHVMRDGVDGRCDCGRVAEKEEP